ncbi:MAG: catechol 2,3-dioxygenase-like lactoylglutathione lyase family enzyme [Sphingobacteriales bacterium]|jgi:catechol 2,3-dioxygenase-like lactoylglutathione lyase family enzyme
MDKAIISGIQQVGIGIPSVYEAWAWYRKNFGFNIPIFDEAAEAPFMIPYTGNTVQSRHAILAMNLGGGGGFEIWQYTSREPQLPIFEPLLGDLGINIAKVKTSDIQKSFTELKSAGVKMLTDVVKDPNGQEHFFVEDPYGNTFELVYGKDWFSRVKSTCGGLLGSIIGVSDIEKSLTLYRDILGYDEVVYDKTGQFEDLNALKGGDKTFRRMLLTHSQERKGRFSKLLGPSTIELIQVTDREPKKIFENRFWGDRGFIHLCFDVSNMKSLQAICEKGGYNFTVDSLDNFDMGEAAGHFSYIEDADGTLIEFVEAYRIPIMKKIGWYLNLQKRAADKPLPAWMLKTLKFGAHKD